MPFVSLNREEMEALEAFPINSIPEAFREEQLALENLLSMLDKPTGELEVPAAVLDMFRAPRLAECPRLAELVDTVFSRSLGDDLTSGFFDQE